jgi:hypothetical protein
VVAQSTIAHGEELFVDYLVDNRSEINYTPDWLVEPPQPNPYLDKKEIVTPLPITIKLLLAFDQARKGRKQEIFEGRVGKELP